tara:strand:+ start:155 stop:646 length:492 start_codon:yes stop_codon:yes gene_type:complete
MPQLNPEFFISQLFWLVVSFSFLLFFLWRFSLPRISSVLDKREKKISDDIATAKKLQIEAEEIQKSIEEKIVNARNEVDDLIKSTLKNLLNESEMELTKLDKELENKINNSVEIIEKNKLDSLNEINRQVFEITKLTLSKIGKFSINDKDIEESIKLNERKLN